jgi:hypothetical protein
MHINESEAVKCTCPFGLYTTWNQSPFLEVGMQQVIRSQGSATVSCKANKKVLLQTVGITDTNAGIVSKLKEDMSQWRKYTKAEAAEDRKTFLQKKATAIVEEKNTTMEKIMKQLRLRESQKRPATKINMVWGKLHKRMWGG